MCNMFMAPTEARRLESDSLKLELRMILSHFVDARNRTLVLWKNQSTLLTTELPL